MSLDFSLYVVVDGHERELFEAGITHNLNKMAEAAGIYESLWRPDEINVTCARDIIDRLSLGLDKLKRDKEYYSKFNSPNGWGMYEHFVPFVENVLNACIKHPSALIHASR